MDKFRVYDSVEKKMYYEGFVLSNTGSLFKIELNLSSEVEKRFTVDKISKTNIMNCFERASERTIKYIPNEDHRYVVQHAIDRKDITNFDLYDGDILRYVTGSEFVIMFGEFNGVFCVGDEHYTSTQGFIACEYSDGEIDVSTTYPLSDLEQYAKCVGNICEGYCSNQTTHQKGIPTSIHEIDAMKYIARVKAMIACIPRASLEVRNLREKPRGFKELIIKYSFSNTQLSIFIGPTGCGKTTYLSKRCREASGTKYIYLASKEVKDMMMNEYNSFIKKNELANCSLEWIPEKKNNGVAKRVINLYEHLIINANKTQDFIVEEAQHFIRDYDDLEEFIYQIQKIRNKKIYIVMQGLSTNENEL